MTTANFHVKVRSPETIQRYIRIASYQIRKAFENKDPLATPLRNQYLKTIANAVVSAPSTEPADNRLLVSLLNPYPHAPAYKVVCSVRYDPVPGLSVPQYSILDIESVVSSYTFHFKEGKLSYVLPRGVEAALIEALNLP